MIPMSELWQPILLSAVLVWIGSAIVWMALPHHKSEYGSLADEETARPALQATPPGQYKMPHVQDYSTMKEPAVRQKFDDGPVAFITVLPNGVPPMGPRLLQSFLFFLLVSLIVAYITSRALPADAHYLTVFRIAGTTAWLAYGFGTIPDSIWFGRPWSSQIKNLLDGLFYSVLTAGAFGWLWPRGM